VTLKTLKSSKSFSSNLIIRSAVVFNIAVLISGTWLVLSHSKKTASSDIKSSLSSLSSAAQVGPLDSVTGADIAVSIAKSARLEEYRAVKNNADSVNSVINTIPSDSMVVAKPQIVAVGYKSKKDIVSYTTTAAETVQSIADKFGVTADSIKWSNDLALTTLPAGKTILIPPVNGIVKKVVTGDTPVTLADKYKALSEQIIAFNDAEIVGLIEGENIVIPDGSIAPPPATVAIANNAGNSGFTWGGTEAVYTASYGFNGYDYGYCTWYVANKRIGAGSPIPANLGHASTWKSLAQRAGLGTGNIPAVGAVMWTPPRDFYGHVAYVEEVYPDGGVRVSEMNVAGWNVVSSRTYSAEAASGYTFIY
jgi:N-acetylmuramoyl-L-alanine amidase